MLCFIWPLKICAKDRVERRRCGEKVTVVINERCKVLCCGYSSNVQPHGLLTDVTSATRVFYAAVVRQSPQTPACSAYRHKVDHILCLNVTEPWRETLKESEPCAVIYC